MADMLDRDVIVAEIGYGDPRPGEPYVDVGEAFEEEGEFAFVIYPSLTGEPLSLPLDEFIAILQRARERLVSLGYGNETAGHD
jgi:hypothetical protein